MAEDTNQNTTGNFGGGDIDLSESVFGPLFDLPGIDGPEDIFGNVGIPSENSSDEGDSSMSDDNMQGASENVNLGPFNRLLDIEGVDGVEDIFGNVGGDSSMGDGGNPFGGGGEGGAPSDMGELAYGGSPFAGDNFWTIFNGGVNPADASSGGGSPMGGGDMGGGGNPFGGGDMGGGGNPFGGGDMGGGGMPSFGSGDMGGGGNPFGGGDMGGGGNPFGGGDMGGGGNPFGGGDMGGGGNPFGGGDMGGV